MKFDANDILEDLINDTKGSDVNPNEVLEELLGEEELEEEIEDFEDEEEIEEEDEDDDEEIVYNEGDEEFSFEEPVKPTKEQKAEYAWAEMRKDNKQKQLELDRLNQIAVGYGFKNHSEMLDKLEEDRLIKEAKAKGQDPEVFKKMHSMENEIETLKKERRAEIERERALKFLNNVDNFIEKNSLSENEKKELIEKLDEDGFTVDDLSKIKNTDALFSSYVKGTLSERERQAQLEKEAKRKRLEEDKFTGTGADAELTLEELMNATVSRARTKKY